MLRLARYLLRKSPRESDRPALLARKRTGWKWFLITLFVVPIIYILSFGPACWWFSTTAPASLVASIKAPQRVSSLYWPIGYVTSRSAQSTGGGGLIFRAVVWYATLRVPSVTLPADNSGQHWITVFRR